MYQLYKERPLLVFAMIVANVLLSAWCIHFDPVINNDGVTYLAIAEYFENGQWRAAFDFYSWPFYSIFIVATSKLFFVDIETAAYLLNTLFVTSLTLAFICIVGELSDNNRRIVLIAAVVILMFPSINKYRSFIIRDFGYLSCYLWSLYFIFRFCNTFRKIHLIGWLLFAGISCLFRFEGITFLLIAPYFLLMFSATNMPHRRKVLSALSVVIVITSVALVAWYLNDKYAAMLEMAARTGENIGGIADLFISNLKQSLAGRELTVVNFLGLAADNIGTMLRELTRRMAVFYLFFAIYAYVKRLTLKKELLRKVWLLFLITNLAVLAGFSMYTNFLVSRYTLATALTLLLLAPFAIDALWQKGRQAGLGGKLLGIVVLLALTVISLERLTESTDKSYLKKSGQWLAENVPPDAEIYSNNKLVIYYARRSPEATLNRLYSTDMMQEFYATHQLHQYQYIALVADATDRASNITRHSFYRDLGPHIYVEREDENNVVLIYKTDRIQRNDLQ